MVKPAERDPPPALTSVNNALRLLLMLENHPELRVTDVANELGIGGSTAHRLLTSLKNAGFLRQRAASRKYVVGRELLRLARHFSDENTLERVARPHMESLCHQIFEAVNLQVLVGVESLCIASVFSDRHALQVRSIVGQRSAAIVMAAGKVLLAGLSYHDLNEALGPIGRTTLDGPPLDLRLLREELRSIQALGFAVTMGDMEPGVHAVAAPIVNPEGHAIAALSVAAPSIRLPPARVPGLVSQLRGASTAIATEYFAAPAAPWLNRTAP